MTCIHCDKEFDEKATTEREEEVWLMDEDWNDYQTMRTYWLCPHCNEWSYES